MERHDIASHPQLAAIFDGQKGKESARTMEGGNGAGTMEAAAIHWFRDWLVRPAAVLGRDYGALLLMQLTPIGPEQVGAIRGLLRNELRSGDAVRMWGPCRLAILLDELRTPSDTPGIAGKLYELLENPYSNARDGDKIPLWIGVHVFERASCDCCESWKLAESALRRALTFSAGICCISGAITGQVVMEHLDFSRDAYEAYRKREFCVEYQPVFGMDGEWLTGIEALLRWQHPRHGLLYPGTFMGALEESGLIVPIGERVLNEACRLAHILSRKAQRSVRVCVNVSARQLLDPGFLFTVLDAIYDADIGAGQLQLECPASVLLQEPEVLGKILTDLANAGVRIAIDQFNAVHTPERALMTMPATLIKMDRTLICGLAHDAVSRAIASGTLAMANGAGFSVAAVGIEDDEQVRALEQMGCIEVQGNSLSRPQTAADLMNWLPAA